jgi:hypothetical protein
MAGCSQKPPEGISDVQPGPLPEGGDWQGVFYNQRYGFLHITTSGNAVDGAWRNTAGDKWGEMHGEIEGDLLRYSWTEYKIGVVGPNSTSTGKGYFKYIVPAEGNHELKGEWGLGEKDAGNPWDCIKQTNMEPDPKSVRPNDLEGRVGAAGFDGAGGDSEVKDLTTEEEEKKKEAEAKEGEADEKSTKGSKKSKKKGAEE